MQVFNQEESSANWMDGMDGLAAFSILPNPNEGFRAAKAGFNCGYPVNLFNDGESNSYGSLQNHTPHADGQNVSTGLGVCNDIHTNQYGATLLLDATLFSDCVTPFPGQDPIGFNHWDGFQADTLSTSLNFGSTLQQNAIGSTDPGYSGRSIGEEAAMHQVGMTNPMYIPNHTSAGFDGIPNSSMLDVNPQHSYGLIAQTPIAPMAANFNFEEASASIASTSMPVAAPISQAPATQPIPPVVPATAPARGTMPCCVPWCPLTFKRKHERDRHAASVHGINHRVYLCHVNGCPKNRGTPFSRRDKLTEHMWKHHGNLGYRKRVV